MSIESSANGPSGVLWPWMLRTTCWLSCARNTETLMQRVGAAFLALTGGERVFLLLQDDETGGLSQTYAAEKNGDLILSRDGRVATIADRVFTEGKPAHVAQAGEQCNPAAPREDRRTPGRKAAHRMVCVPLCVPASIDAEDAQSVGQVPPKEDIPLWEDRTAVRVGVLYIDGGNTADGMMAGDLRIAALFAEHAAVALETARLFTRASNDNLTGLPNVSAFLPEIATALRHASLKQPLGLVLLDLDQFKRVNQSAGSQAGDRALIDIAKTLGELAGDEGYLSRFGSDKFAILITPGDANDGTAVAMEVRLHDLAERIRATIRTKIYHGVQISASVAGLVYPGPSETQDSIKTRSATEVVAAADNLLRRARALGPGGLQISAVFANPSSPADDDETEA